jgi:chromosome segregation ATPase
MNRRNLKAFAGTHEAVMAELSQISSTLEVLAQAALTPLIITGDDSALRAELAAKESACQFLIEERQHLGAQVADQAERADVAEAELVEARLDLNNARVEIAELKAETNAANHVLAQANRDIDRLSTELANTSSLCAQRGRELIELRSQAPAKSMPVPAQVAQGATALTPLAEQVRMLIGKGHNDASIRAIVNNYLAPEDWLNAGGVKALRAIVGVAG